MAASEEKKRLVVEYVARKMAELKMSEADLTEAARLDPQTVRTFLRGETYPQAAKRGAIERALDVPLGSLELVGNRIVTIESPQGDRVEIAIKESDLTRANQHTLIGTYYGMLDDQGERGTA